MTNYNQTNDDHIYLTVVVFFMKFSENQIEWVGELVGTGKRI